MPPPIKEEDLKNYPHAKTLQQKFAPGWDDSLWVNPGWYPLLDSLAADLNRIEPDYQLDQVKEKFGALRFYYQLPEGTNQDTREQFMARVDQAEMDSATICDICGTPGTLGGTGWVATRCETHKN